MLDLLRSSNTSDTFENCKTKAGRMKDDVSRILISILQGRMKDDVSRILISILHVYRVVTFHVLCNFILFSFFEQRTMSYIIQKEKRKKKRKELP
jgi:hypothetical protein